MGFGVRGLASLHPFLGAMVGMDQKDRCSGLFQAGFVGYCAPRAVFPFLIGRPRMLGILAGADLKYICSGMYKAGFLVFIHLELFARGVQEIGLFGRRRVFFFAPCIWKSLVRALA